MHELLIWDHFKPTVFDNAIFSQIEKDARSESDAEISDSPEDENEQGEKEIHKMNGLQDISQKNY